MTSVVTVIGTRAQMVKMAPVILALEAKGASVLVVASGQHAQSMHELAEDLGISHHFKSEDFGLERHSILKLALWVVPSFLSMVSALRNAKKAGTEVCLVHGDTLSTILGAVAAKLAGLSVGHIESGLTSGQLFSPFPEEAIRRLVFRLANRAFCPSDESALLMRAFAGVEVIHTHGNTVEDALRSVAINSDGPRYGAVVSIHRYENIFERRRLSFLVQQLIDISDGMPISFVLHPPTERQLKRFDLYNVLHSAKGIELLPRMPYTHFVRLLAASELVITDGGSNQEELAVLGIPTIVMRPASERPDGLGANAVLEPDVGDIRSFILGGAFRDLARPARREMGGASEKIACSLISRA